VQLDIGKQLDQAIDEGPLAKALQARDLAVRQDLHLLDHDAAIVDPTTRHDLETVEELERVRPRPTALEPIDSFRGP